MKKTSLLALAFAASLTAPQASAQVQGNMCAGYAEAAKLPPEQDGVVAAPDNHRVILENEELRVLDVVVRPGEREVLHHHRWPSVFVVDAHPKFVTRDQDGNLISERYAPPTRADLPLVMRVPPQVRVHSIHNLDTLPFHAIRIEYKKLCDTGK